MVEPLSVTIEYGPQKIAGFVMKINSLGMMIEVDEIPYRVGATVKVSFQLPRMSEVAVEEMRAIKAYDRFFRAAPGKKRKAPVKKDPTEEPAAEPKPKKLTELHFLKLKPEIRTHISKYLMDMQVEIMKRSR